MSIIWHFDSSAVSMKQNRCNTSKVPLMQLDSALNELPHHRWHAGNRPQQSGLQNSLTPDVLISSGDNFTDLSKEAKVAAALEWLKQQKSR